MTPQELQYNKKCAEFKGYELEETLNGKWVYAIKTTDQYFKSNTDFYELHELKFHSDWNWIMDVVDAIEKLDVKYWVTIRDNSCDIHNVFVKDNDINIYVSQLNLNKKETAIIAINKFLDWYNSNNTSL